MFSWKRSMILGVFIILVIVILVFYFVWNTLAEKRPPVLLKNTAGMETTSFQMGESVVFNAIELAPRTGYEVRVVRQDGRTVATSKLSTDGRGRIEDTVIWYDIGLLPEKTAAFENAANVPEYDFRDYEYAARYFVKIFQKEKLIRESVFSIDAIARRPVLYASNAKGYPKSGFLIGEENVWVTGRNFPKGSIVRLWAVPNTNDWQDATPLQDVTKQYENRLPMLFELKPEEAGFRKLLWPKGLTSIGSYDIVAEVVTYPFGAYHSTATAGVRNIIANSSNSGFVIQRRPGVNEPLEMHVAGTRQSPFTFRDTFLTTENVFVGVDPAIQPGYIGQTADIYIVADKTDAQWTVDPDLHDVTGYVESIYVGGVCTNCWSTLAWAAPLTPGKYDVVLDFNHDGKYTPGVDLIDSLDAAGFTVSEIRVDSISFRYGGSNAITIYDNINATNINAPEYLSAAAVVKPAAWVKGGVHSVQVNFKAMPGVNSAKIWAENGLGGLNSSGSPVSVSFSGGNGQALFTVNSPPANIGKFLFNWDWKYKDVNGTSSAALGMGSTGTHILYTTYAVPQAPMITPWLDVLDRSCQWAQGESDLTQARIAVTSGLNSIGDLDGDVDYNPANLYTSNGFSAWQFNLTDFLHDLATTSSLQLNCADCANALQVFQNALGLNLQYRVLHMGGTTNYIDPIGNGNTANGTDPVQNWAPTGWGWHCVGWLSGDIVYDACLHLDGDGTPGSSPCIRLAPAALPFTTYRNALAPATTPCNPVEQNVCTVF